MTQTEEKAAKLAKKYFDLDHEPDLERDFAEVKVSSMDAIAFAKALAQEFDMDIPAEDFADFQNLRHICNYLDAKAG